MMASEGASGDECGVGFRGSKHSQETEETPLLGGSPSTNTARKQKFRSFDEALGGMSVGVFHLVLVLVCGWAIASDSVEIQCISFVTPQLDQGNNISAEDEVMRAHTHTHTHSLSLSHTHIGLCPEAEQAAGGYTRCHHLPGHDGGWVCVGKSL